MTGPITVLEDGDEMPQLHHRPCADPESFVRGGPNFDGFFFVFLVDGGRAGVPMVAQY